MLQAKVESVSPHILSVSHKMSFGNQIVAGLKGNEIKILNLVPGGADRIATVKGSALPWVACNPFALMVRVQTTDSRIEMSRSFHRIDRAFAGARTSLDNIKGLIFTSKFADENYYAVSNLARKLREGSLPKALVPHAFETLKAAVAAAFAENDLPMIGFLNGYLVDLPRTPEILELEKFYPGMTTVNICGSRRHTLNQS